MDSDSVGLLVRFSITFHPAGLEILAQSASSCDTLCQYYLSVPKGSESPSLGLFHSLQETQMTTPPHRQHTQTRRHCLPLPQWCCHVVRVCLYGQGQQFGLPVICCGGVVAPCEAQSNLFAFSSVRPLSQDTHAHPLLQV